MPDDIADFVGGKPGIQRDREIMEPDFRLFVIAADVHMSRLTPFV